MALLSAASTCGYTLADGIGARVNGSGPGYALWMFVLNAVTMQSIALALRGSKAYEGLRTHWLVMAGGGAMSMCAYFIVIWAMTQAPIALVAALRETSVLFGALIAIVILKEVMTGWRALASAFVLLGMVLLKMA
jgi:drug/metabolite transporter (DMT)-like permease